MWAEYGEDFGAELQRKMFWVDGKRLKPKYDKQPTCTQYFLFNSFKVPALLYFYSILLQPALHCTPALLLASYLTTLRSILLWLCPSYSMTKRCSEFMLLHVVAQAFDQTV